jgi:16S rRNA (guanine527-N7)-methyltransferase
VSPDSLSAVLTDAQRVGLLGPAAVEDHIEHARSWSRALAPDDFIDLGSGAGVPGLVLATLWPHVRGCLLDGQRRRADWLRAAIARLDLVARVEVIEGRAEEVGHDPDRRESMPLVVARGFGPPSATAECGSSFVRPGGVLSVSEPPGPEIRWPQTGLEQIGLGIPRRIVQDGRSFVILPKSSSLGSTFPRRRTLLLREPLW